MKTLFKIATVLLVMGGAAYGSITYLNRSNGQGNGNAPSAGAAPRQAAPLQVAVAEVRPEPIQWTVNAVGSVEANETVEITSEQSRRLISIHFEDGELVERGDLLFQLDVRDLEVRKMELEALLELAKLNQERTRNLLSQQATTEAEFDSLRAQVRVLESQIENVTTELDRARITAPFSGRIGLRRVSPGAWLTPSTTMATLADDSRVKIDFKLPERFASAVSIGSPFRFRVETSPHWKEATVTAIEPRIEIATRSLIIRGEADNSEGLFFPGAFVQVELTVTQRENALLVPSKAIVPSMTGNSVFVVVDGKAEERRVETANRTADRVEVTSGVQVGDRVILDNLLRMRNGSDVEIREVVEPGIVRGEAEAAP